MKTLPLTAPQTPFEQSVETSLRLLQVPDLGRPVNPLQGQPAFDPTLGKPIWWFGSHWVDATGTAV